MESPKILWRQYISNAYSVHCETGVLEVEANFEICTYGLNLKSYTKF